MIELIEQYWWGIFGVPSLIIVLYLLYREYKQIDEDEVKQ